MNEYEFRPIECKHNNMKYVSEGCYDLPVTAGKNVRYSVWKLKSFKERIKFLFKGTVTLCVASNGHPPVNISNGDILNIDGMWD